MIERLFYHPLQVTMNVYTKSTQTILHYVTNHFPFLKNPIFAKKKTQYSKIKIKKERKKGKKNSNKRGVL
jgi:pyrroloquinoline quinone (PQQ) biosynthesis protein C